MQAGEWLVIYYKDNQNRNRRAFGYLCAIRQRIPTRTTARKGEHLDYESNWYRDNTLLCVSWAHKISDIRRPSDEDKKIIQRAGLGDDDMVLSDWFDVVPLSTVTTFAEGECLSATVLVRRLGRPKGPKDLALSSGVILFRKTNVDATGVLAQSRPAHLRVSRSRILSVGLWLIGIRREQSASKVRLTAPMSLLIWTRTQTSCPNQLKTPQATYTIITTVPTQTALAVVKTAAIIRHLIMTSIATTATKMVPVVSMDFR